MSNRWEIPRDAELRLKQKFKACAYCGRTIKPHLGVVGRPDKATIEHLNRHPPFYRSKGLQEKHLVLACAQCNSSRSDKRLTDWFASPYCLIKEINAGTVAPRVKQYLRTASSKL